MLREANHMALDRADRRVLSEVLQVIKARLYEDVFQSAWDRGRSITVEEAYEEVVRELDDRPPQ
jgi:hypothetical protein